jgi:hypothetical protein
LSNKKGEESTKNKTQDGTKSSNETGSPKDEDTSSTANAQPIETEPPGDEDTSSTANAQPIETEPPEEEDPGTCETTGDWAMSGECQADGTAIFTQTYKESKPGACPSHEKAGVKPCCYQKGDWTDTSGCNERGRKTQKQTTINCAENFKTREVDCPYVGPWRKIGGCNSAGKQYYIRDVVNSSETKEKSENCCYTSAWGGWTPIGDCNGSTRPHQRTRSAINCPAGTATSENNNLSCNHCQGAWGGWGGWSGWSGSTSCGTSRKRYSHRYYNVTKNATNGGKPCPHPNRKRDTRVGYSYNGSCNTTESCFAPDTKIKLENGDVINIKDVMIGDVLEGGVNVNATLQIRNIDKSPFYKILNKDLNEYTYVTGSHMIKEGDTFVKVEQSTIAEVSDVINDSFISLITDNHKIPIGGNTFWDWADECDICDKCVV